MDLPFSSSPGKDSGSSTADIRAAFGTLDRLGCQYAFYFHRQGQPPFFKGNCDPVGGRFLSASMIKIPILLAWVALERDGFVSRFEMCDLDAEPQVQGAGFSWLLHNRRLPYQDVLLLMMALSDNLCTNLVIRRVGVDTLRHVFKEQLGLPNTELQRKLMDYAARAQGLDNWITAQDCIRFFDLIDALSPEERAWVDPLFAANQDDLLLMRRIQRDTLVFHHKTGSMTGVLHDWGYTDTCRIFLLTQNVADEPAAYEVFGQLGKLLAA